MSTPGSEAGRPQHQWICSLDKGNNFVIYCPFGLSQNELGYVKDFLAIFIRQAERHSIAEKEVTDVQL